MFFFFECPGRKKDTELFYLKFSAKMDSTLLKTHLSKVLAWPQVILHWLVCFFGPSQKGRYSVSCHRGQPVRKRSSD